MSRRKQKGGGLAPNKSSNVPKTAAPIRPDLLDVLHNQVAFLVASSKAFDEGFEHEGVRLAATLRVLMHQTGASHSLLGQMGLREKMLYFDTASPYSKLNVAPETALTSQRISVNANETHGRYLPHFDRPTSDGWSGFRRWWELNSIIRDSRGEAFTRKDLVLYAANEDGGAHVQPSLTVRYEALSRQNSLGYQLVPGGMAVGFGTGAAPSGGAAFDWDNGPALPSVRMIAHEMLVTIQRFVPEAMGGVQVRERAEGPEQYASLWVDG